MPKQTSTAKRRNSVPRLVINLRVTLGDIAAWTGMSSSMVEKWQSGAYQPKNGERDRLVAHVREHAHTLLSLCNTVEAEGNHKDT